MARKKKSESKALVPVDENLPSTELFDQSLFQNQEIDNEDILIPKIWLMQQMSDMVVKKSAESGEFRDSLTGELLKKPLEVILFAPYKTWQVTNTPKGKKRADYVETLNFYENQDLPIEEEEADGSITHRDKVLGFFCLLADKIESEPFPYVIDFKRTSRRAGQSIVTKIAKLRSKKLPCYATTFIIDSKEEQNEGNIYFTKSAIAGRAIKKEEIAVVEEWIKTIKNAQDQKLVKVDDSDVKKETEITASKKAQTKQRKKRAEKKQKF